MNDFENQLQRQPLRTLPPEWRKEILKATALSTPRPNFLSTLNSQLSTFFWPCPQAWAGLAAAWLLILGLHFASHTSESHGMSEAKAELPPSPQVLAMLREQRALYTELLGRPEIPPPSLPPRPRSERTVDFIAV